MVHFLSSFFPFTFQTVVGTHKKREKKMGKHEPFKRKTNVPTALFVVNFVLSKFH